MFFLKSRPAHWHLRPWQSAQSILSSQTQPQPTTPTITTTRPTDDAIEALIHHATTSRPHLENRPLRDTRTQLFVGNLPYRVRWQDLKDLFRKAGTVLRADVSLGPDNRSRGYGTVLLATAEDAGRAVDMFNGYTWQTRVLEVRLDRLMPEYEQGATSTPVGIGSLGAGPSIGVGNPMSGAGNFSAGGMDSLGTTTPANLGTASMGGASLTSAGLPFHIQWQDLKDLFRQAGTILRADVALGPDNRSRGFGTVVFATDSDTERAVRMFNG
ncbi:hypothetical protein CPB83DRAFT_763507 [Crepidotus variabilis]|uniref:RRM domain-containing protein n=1 Tax=Crepidotus variabilis TaxID=179855 RepID=A0A9P6EJS5_9AGAR|nr:hypothetical protein CPB83DRAFT_763507 [Crepidotus variabilis]